MLEKILRMTHSDLPQILIDGHSSLLAKLLRKRAHCTMLHHKIYPAQRTFQASRQPGNQLIQQRFAGCWRQRITGVTMAIQQHHQLPEKQLCHFVSKRHMLTTFMLKLTDNLPRPCHPHDEAPVWLPCAGAKSRNRPCQSRFSFAALVETKILQNQIVNGSVGVFIVSMNVKEIATVSG